MANGHFASRVLIATVAALSLTRPVLDQPPVQLAVFTILLSRYSAELPRTTEVTLSPLFFFLLLFSPLPFPCSATGLADNVAAVRNRRIFEMWLACYTQQEIADAVGIPRKTVDDTFGEFGDVSKLAKSDQSAAEHATDFTPCRQVVGGRACSKRSGVYNINTYLCSVVVVRRVDRLAFKQKRASHRPAPELAC